MEFGMKSQTFLQTLAPEVREALDVPGIDGELTRFIQRARAAWPELSVDERVFVAYAAARFGPGQTRR